MRRSHAVTALLAGTLMAGGLAAQSVSAQVEALLRRGVALRQRGDDAGALDQFQRARALSDEPRVLAQVALAEQALGRWVDAARDLREAASHEDDPWIRRNAAALGGARDEIMRHVGGLTVEGPGAQGELRVDDARVAALPMTAPVVVLAGERALEVRREGYTPWTQAITVRPGELNRVDVPALQALVVTPVAPVAPPRRGQGQRIAGWSLVGLSAASLGVGIYGLVARDNAQGAFQQDRTCATAMPAAACADRRSTADTMNAVMIAGFVGAGVLAAVGVTLVLTAPSNRPAVTLACAPGLRAVGCALSF
ncbi:MAG: hypothetical protein U0325_05610 [Polyangiales bacterium]